MLSRIDKKLISEACQYLRPNNFQQQWDHAITHQNIKFLIHNELLIATHVDSFRYDCKFRRGRVFSWDAKGLLIISNGEIIRFRDIVDCRGELWEVDRIIHHHHIYPGFIIAEMTEVQNQQLWKNQNLAAFYEKNWLPHLKCIAPTCAPFQRYTLPKISSASGKLRASLEIDKNLFKKLNHSVNNKTQMTWVCMAAVILFFYHFFGKHAFSFWFGSHSIKDAVGEWNHLFMEKVPITFSPESSCNFTNALRHLSEQIAWAEKNPLLLKDIFLRYKYLNNYESCNLLTFMISNEITDNIILEKSPFAVVLNEDGSLLQCYVNRALSRNCEIKKLFIHFPRHIYTLLNQITKFPNNRICDLAI